MLPPAAHADTLTEYIVASSSGSIDNIGLTSSGSLVVLQTIANTYLTFTPPSSYSSSSMLPVLSFDNGSSCTPTDTSAYSYVANARCNGNYEVFAASVGNSSHLDLFDGPDPVADLVSSSARLGYANLLLNSNGDIATVAVDNGNSLSDQNLLFVRSVSPEPTSLVLLITGLLGAMGTWRKRRQAGTKA